MHRVKQFWNEWDDVIRVFLVVLVIYFFSMRGFCMAKTVDIGYPSRWSIMAGCQIEVKESQWIPLESYYFKEE